MQSVKAKIKKAFPKIRFGENLKNHCTFRVGGKADFFYELNSVDELPALIQFAKKNKIPYFLLGKGSNILFDDKGFRGLVIKNKSDKISIKNNLAEVDSGVLVAKLVQETVKKGLSPLEKWVGLPGTVGGAVYGNAGCNGLETKDVLKSVLILNPKTGKIKTVPAKSLGLAYRASKLKKSGEIILKATFQLKKSPFSKLEQRKLMISLGQARVAKQPPGLSAGSFFKNPSPKTSAGTLIDRCGLKGKTINKAQISTKHANFLLNLGGAKAQDIINLAKLAKRLVKAKFGLDLEPEVRILTVTGKTKPL